MSQIGSHSLSPRGDPGRDGFLPADLETRDALLIREIETARRHFAQQGAVFRALAQNASPEAYVQVAQARVRQTDAGSLLERKLQEYDARGLDPYAPVSAEANLDLNECWGPDLDLFTQLRQERQNYNAPVTCLRTIRGLPLLPARGPLACGLRPQ